MKCLLSISALLLAGVTAQAALFTSGVMNTVIPDGNPNGTKSTISVSGLTPATSDVVVYLNVSGGYNGDLYASLNLGGPSGTTAVLLNRIGSSPSNPLGSSTAGFGDPTGESYAFSLSDAAVTSIHNYAGAGVSFQPDGAALSSFNGQNPNGDWTLFFADMASGGGSGPSTLVSWGLDIEPVPEPVNVALAVFGILFIGAGAIRAVRARSARATVKVPEF
jgi:subtilisin-like proprotein convertase family protein